MTPLVIFFCALATMSLVAACLSKDLIGCLIFAVWAVVWFVVAAKHYERRDKEG